MSGEDRKIYTRNGWGRCKTTLEMGGEDVKSHSKRVDFKPLGSPRNDLAAEAARSYLAEVGISVNYSNEEGVY